MRRSHMVQPRSCDRTQQVGQLMLVLPGIWFRPTVLETASYIWVENEELKNATHIQDTTSYFAE